VGLERAVRAALAVVQGPVHDLEVFGGVVPGVPNELVVEAVELKNLRISVGVGLLRIGLGGLDGIRLLVG
jgi:hypothetical protein